LKALFGRLNGLDISKDADNIKSELLVFISSLEAVDEGAKKVTSGPSTQPTQQNQSGVDTKALEDKVQKILAIFDNITKNLYDMSASKQFDNVDINANPALYFDSDDINNLMSGLKSFSEEELEAIGYTEDLGKSIHALFTDIDGVKGFDGTFDIEDYTIDETNKDLGKLLSNTKMLIEAFNEFKKAKDSALGTSGTTPQASTPTTPSSSTTPPPSQTT